MGALERLVLGCRVPLRQPSLRATTALLQRTALGAVVPLLRSVPSPGIEQLSSFACKSDPNPRVRTKWYGVYTDEQYMAQRQSEERARWAAGVRTITGNQSQSSWEGSPLDPPALLGGVAVVIISPRKPVSVGTVARACGSFECEDLRIVMPRQESYITRHAKSASKGAQYILYRAGHYDSLAEATADCDVRIAFTRWAQASSPNVFKVDISGLTSHPAVQRVIGQPLQSREAASAAAAAAPRPPSAPWSEAAAAAAAAAEARLAAGYAATASSDGSSGEEDSEERQRQWQGGPADTSGGASVAAGGVAESRGDELRNHTAEANGYQRHEHSSTPSPGSSLTDGGRSSGSSSNSSAGDSSLPVLGTSAGGPTGRPPRVALVFGREELGMSDEEVDSCEVCCSIPIGRLQESLSLSHAVSIALCALYQARLQHLAGQQPHQAQAAAAAAGGPPPPFPPAAGGEGSPPLQYTVDASTGAVRVAMPAVTGTGAASAAAAV